MAGDRPLVVVMSAVGWSGVRGSERQLAEALAGGPADVLWVDPPVSAATPGRYLGTDGRRPWRPRLQRIGPRIVRLTPVAIPGWTRPGVRAVNPPMVRAQVTWAVRRVGRAPVAVVLCTPRADPAGWLPGAVRVLYGTDDWVAGAALMKTGADQMARAEQAALGVADIVLAVGPELVERWRRAGHDPVLFPNGCDPATYAGVAAPGRGPAQAGSPGPVAGLVGQLNGRTDIAILEAVADTGIDLLLVGPREPAWEPRRFAALVDRGNVMHTGAVPYEDLPSWYARIDVGLTPYVVTPFNRASFPLKTLEYLAAGRPVVSTDLPASRRLGQEAPDIRIETGAAGFAAAVLDVAGRRSSDADVERRRSVARRYSWSTRAEELAGLIEHAGARQGVGATGTRLP